ncbi:MAG: hypothetical protein QOI66_3180 [Myxococcales bacterium]|nr:hypothetical protein [Myxococcales bacterium]
MGHPHGDPSFWSDRRHLRLGRLQAASPRFAASQITRRRHFQGKAPGSGLPIPHAQQRTDIDKIGQHISRPFDPLPPLPPPPLVTPAARNPTTAPTPKPPRPDSHHLFPPEPAVPPWSVPATRAVPSPLPHPQTCPRLPHPLPPVGTLPYRCGPLDLSIYSDARRSSNMFSKCESIKMNWEIFFERLSISCFAIVSSGVSSGSISVRCHSPVTGPVTEEPTRTHHPR